MAREDQQASLVAIRGIINNNYAMIAAADEHGSARMTAPLNPVPIRDHGCRSTPILLQTEAAECGLACIAMIASHYGHRLDLAALRRRFDVSLKGMTLANVVRLAGSIGLGTRAVRVELLQLRRLRLPAVLHWDHNHFVVLTGVRQALARDQ